MHRTAEKTAETHVTRFTCHVLCQREPSHAPLPAQRGVEVVHAPPQLRGLGIGRELGGALRLQRLRARRRLRAQRLPSNSML